MHKTRVWHSYIIIVIASLSFEANGRKLWKRTTEGSTTDVFNSECMETVLISPSRESDSFEPEPETLQTSNTKCHWIIVGTENCIPTLTCENFKLASVMSPESDDPCTEEYFEVMDGNEGYERFCATNGPKNLTTSKGLRDLYVTLQVGTNNLDIDGRGFQCTVTCHKDEPIGKPIENSFSPSDNQMCHCGRKPNDDRIVGGDDAKRSEFPWIVGLVATNTLKPYCGAVIINDRFVLTAAHCFKGPYTRKENFQVILNGHVMDLTLSKVAHGEGGSKSNITLEEVKAKDVQFNVLRYNVEKYYIHPFYVRQTNDFDIALLKLTEPIDFRKFSEVQPICMPELADYKKVYDNSIAIVAGWGLNSSDAITTMATLQKLNITIFPNDECKGYYNERFTRRMMCAGFREGGKDSCKGDSGGPLIQEKTNQIWSIIGVVSWGEGCASRSLPGVYLKIVEVDQWIRFISNNEDAVWCVE